MINAAYLRLPVTLKRWYPSKQRLCSIYHEDASTEKNNSFDNDDFAATKHQWWNQLLRYNAELKVEQLCNKVNLPEKLTCHRPIEHYVHTHTHTHLHLRHLRLLRDAKQWRSLLKLGAAAHELPHDLPHGLERLTTSHNFSQLALWRAERC